MVAKQPVMWLAPWVQTLRRWARMVVAFYNANTQAAKRVWRRQARSGEIYV